MFCASWREFFIEPGYCTLVARCGHRPQPSTSGAYSVPGYVGDDDDILVCALNNGQCSYGLFFDWGDFGVDGFYYTESANGQ